MRIRNVKENKIIISAIFFLFSDDHAADMYLNLVDIFERPNN